MGKHAFDALAPDLIKAHHEARAAKLKFQYDQELQRQNHEAEARIAADANALKERELAELRAQNRRQVWVDLVAHSDTAVAALTAVMLLLRQPAVIVLASSLLSACLIHRRRVAAALVTLVVASGVLHLSDALLLWHALCLLAAVTFVIVSGATTVLVRGGGGGCCGMAASAAAAAAAGATGDQQQQPFTTNQLPPSPPGDGAVPSLTFSGVRVLHPPLGVGFRLGLSHMCFGDRGEEDAQQPGACAPTGAAGCLLVLPTQGRSLDELCGLPVVTTVKPAAIVLVPRDKAPLSLKGTVLPDALRTTPLLRLDSWKFAELQRHLARAPARSCESSSPFVTTPVTLECRLPNNTVSLAFGGPSSL